MQYLSSPLLQGSPGSAAITLRVNDLGWSITLGLRYVSPERTGIAARSTRRPHCRFCRGVIRSVTQAFMDGQMLWLGGPRM